MTSAIDPNIITAAPVSKNAMKTQLTTAKNEISALQIHHKGPAAPSGAEAGWIWIEDDNPSSTRWTMRMYDGTDWIALGIIDSTTNLFEPALGQAGATGLALLAAANAAAARSTIGVVEYLIEHRTFTSQTQVDFTGLSSSLIYKFDLAVTGWAANVEYCMRFSTDNGASFLTTSYEYAYMQHSNVSSTGGSSNAANRIFFTPIGNGSTYTWIGTVELWMENGVTYVRSEFNSSEASVGRVTVSTGAGRRASTTANAVRFIAGTGETHSGRITVTARPKS